MFDSIIHVYLKKQRGVGGEGGVVLLIRDRH